MRLLLTLFAAISIHTIYAQQTAPSVLWQKQYGGMGFDELSIFFRTTDGGYILGSYDSNYVGMDKTVVTKGGTDFWIIKLDSNGNKLWDKGYGGNDEEILYSGTATGDGGCLIGGSSRSGNTGDKSDINRNALKNTSDYWVIKLDPNGNKLWDRTYGGIDEDICTSIIQTSDNGFIIGGISKSGISGEKTEPARHTIGWEDYWIIKTDSSGLILWDRTFGGSNRDHLRALIQTDDGGYVLFGQSLSQSGFDKTDILRGNWDYWVVKLDGFGNKQWDKTFGTYEDEYASDISKASDGGYLLTGSTVFKATNNDKSVPGAGIWMIKIDSNGHKLWERIFRGADNLIGPILTYKTVPTANGWLVTADGELNKGNDKSEVSRGSYDMWILHIDTAGSIIWEKTFGGSGSEIKPHICEVEDGYMVVSQSFSDISGDKTVPIGLSYDFWLLKLGKANTFVSNQFLMANTMASIMGGNGTLSLRLLKEDAVQYMIYDIGGRKIADGTLSDNLTVNAQPGLYYVILQHQGQKQLAKAVVY